MLASIFTAGGWKCGRFLSPHLHRFNERFAIDDQIIPDAAFAACVSDVREAALAVEADDPDIGRLTAWELSTVIALLWFQQQACDVVVLEVGMGGTLDATNVVHPAASLITRLDLEHTTILGNTIEEIAANKAGIIKAGAPAYSVLQEMAALATIRQRAEEVGTSLATAGAEWRVIGDSDDFNWEGWGISLAHLSTSLEGQHQVENAGLAIATVMDPASLLAAQLPVTEGDIRRGLTTAFIPGRFEIVAVDGSTTVVLDGAHTPASAQVLAKAVRSRYADHRVTAIVAMMADKEPLTFLEPLVSVVDQWIVSQPQTPRALDPDALLVALRQLHASAEVCESVGESVSRSVIAARGHDQRRLILVTGSLSTVAEARSRLGLDATST